MTWTALFSGIVGFSLAWLIHVIWWRIARPRDDLRYLFICMLILPSIIGALISITFQPGLIEVLMAFLTLTSLSAVYVCWYPAAQAASPTMLIVLCLGWADKTGLTRAEIDAFLDKDQLCMQLIRELENERFARLEAGKLTPAARGKRLLAALGGLRRLVGLTEARG